MSVTKGRTPRLAAIVTRSARESGFILHMAWGAKRLVTDSVDLVAHHRMHLSRVSVDGERDLGATAGAAFVDGASKRRG